MSAGKKAKKEKVNQALQNFEAARQFLLRHPIFSPLLHRAETYRNLRNNLCPAGGWAVVEPLGYINVHPSRLASPNDWIFILAHCLLHLGLEHFQHRDKPREWNVACDCVVNKFIADMKLCQIPLDIEPAPVGLPNSEEKIYRQFCTQGIPDPLLYAGTAGYNSPDMVIDSKSSHTCYSYYSHYHEDWRSLFARGISNAVARSVDIAAGVEPGEYGETTKSAAVRAKEWFISSYPLLGALAASFKTIEDIPLCQALQVQIAAVDEERREIYINPIAALSEYESKFVMAHEMLHAGLRHGIRQEGRDSYLWNIACDYVINGWLVEMEIGDLPRIGVLYDPELKGLSAESVYDRIVTDIRRFRKLNTLRGYGLGDILPARSSEGWRHGGGTTLDEFYRNALGQGLVYHESQGRGFIPAGLIEEIRALSHPPIPWDVELAQWFDNYFAPVEVRRTYARASRRQSSCPGIPLPRWVPLHGAEDGRTFGVIIDTSGSMNHRMLARALGAIASYSISRDVPFIRVIFCDAAAYDEGYLSPEDIAGRVKIKGRGGTVLQPGVDLLENAEDFPEDGPLLIITDGQCDMLRIRRDHAFLMPKGAHLPFVPKGKVFRAEL